MNVSGETLATKIDQVVQIAVFKEAALFLGEQELPGNQQTFPDRGAVPGEVLLGPGPLLAQLTQILF